MDAITEKVIVDSRKARDLAKVIDDRVAGLYPADWQKESLDSIQNLMLILVEQLDEMCRDAEEMERAFLKH